MALFRGLQFVRNYSLLSRSRVLPLRGGDASNAAGYVRERKCVLSCKSDFSFFSFQNT